MENRRGLKLNNMSKGSRNRSISKAFNDNYSQINWAAKNNKDLVIDFTLHCIDDHGYEYDFHVKEIDYISALSQAYHNMPREDKVISIEWGEQTPKFRYEVQEGDYVKYGLWVRNDIN